MDDEQFLLLRLLDAVELDDVGELCRSLQPVSPSGMLDKLLLFAAEQGHVRCVDVLLAKGASINAKDAVGNTPLILATEHEHVDTVRILLQAPRCDISNTGTYGLSALHRAAWHGNNEIVALLLGAGVDVNITDHAHETALHVAAQKGHTEVMRLLLQEKALDVDKRNMFGRTALMRAVEANQQGVCEILQRAGACSSTQDDLSCHSNAIHVAVVNNHVTVLKTLLRAGAQMGKRCSDGQTEMHHAAKEGFTECAKALLENGASANVVNRYGDTPLVLAAKNNHTETLQVLLDNGADVNATCFGRQTALYVAVMRNHVTCARKLLEAGADPNLVADLTSTLVIQAASMCSRPMVETLLRYDIDVNFMQPSNRTALSYAVENACDPQMVKMLVTAGAKPDINLGGRFVFGPLHMACRCGNVQCAKTLLELGASPDGVSRAGPSPLITAGAGYHMDIVDLLITAGADINMAVTLGPSAWLDSNNTVPRDTPVTALQYALITANIHLIIRLVSSANCDTANVNRDFFSPSLNSKTLIKWLEEESAKPKLLKSLSRWSILSSMRLATCDLKAISNLCKKMPLPNSLKNYLARCCYILNQ